LLNINAQIVWGFVLMFLGRRFFLNSVFRLLVTLSVSNILSLNLNFALGLIVSSRWLLNIEICLIFSSSLFMSLVYLLSRHNDQVLVFMCIVLGKLRSYKKRRRVGNDSPFCCYWTCSCVQLLLNITAWKWSFNVTILEATTFLWNYSINKIKHSI